MLVVLGVAGFASLSVVSQLIRHRERDPPRVRDSIRHHGRDVERDVNDDRRAWHQHVHTPPRRIPYDTVIKVAKSSILDQLEKDFNCENNIQNQSQSTDEINKTSPKNADPFAKRSLSPCDGSPSLLPAISHDPSCSVPVSSLGLDQLDLGAYRKKVRELHRGKDVIHVSLGQLLYTAHSIPAKLKHRATNTEMTLEEIIQQLKRSALIPHESETATGTDSFTETQITKGTVTKPTTATLEHNAFTSDHSSPSCPSSTSLSASSAAASCCSPSSGSSVYLTPLDFPPLSVVSFGGGLWCLSNGRLYCYRSAYSPHTIVSVRVVGIDKVDRERFTTRNAGASVVIDGKEDESNKTRNKEPKNEWNPDLLYDNE